MFQTNAVEKVETRFYVQSFLLRISCLWDIVKKYKSQTGHT